MFCRSARLYFVVLRPSSQSRSILSAALCTRRDHSTVRGGPSSLFGAVGLRCGPQDLREESLKSFAPGVIGFQTKMDIRFRLLLP